MTRRPAKPKQRAGTKARQSVKTIGGIEPSEKLPPESVEWMLRHAGEGVSNQIKDYGFWLPPEVDEKWVCAFEAFDKHRDLRPVLALLKDCVPPTVCPYLEDFFKRYELKPKPGRPRTPSYDRTPAEGMLLLGIERAREYVEEKMPASEAIARAARDLRISEQTLATAYAGKRGSSRRMKSRQT